MRTVLSSSADPLLGRLLDGRYEVSGRLAQGGMAVVYTAFDTRLDRQVAVKVMHPALAADEDFVARFRREAKAAARLSNPHVVSVTDQGQDGDVIFLVMELIEGRTLREVLREHGRLGAPEALDIMIPVLEALAAAHRAGLVHRDVKPENVLVADDGTVKVGDFGLARAVDASPLTATTGLLLGTVAYLAPEQVARGVADARADVYACGVMLFELLTGKPPFEGPTPLQVAYQHLNDDVPAPSSRAVNIPKSVDRLVADATSRDPAGRPHDATAMLFRTKAVLDRIAPEGVGSISHHPTAPLEIDLDLAEAAALEEARKRRWAPRRPLDPMVGAGHADDGDDLAVDAEFVDGIDGIPPISVAGVPAARATGRKHDTLDDLDDSIDDADLVDESDLLEAELGGDDDASDADDEPRGSRRSRRRARREAQRERDREIKAGRKRKKSGGAAGKGPGDGRRRRRFFGPGRIALVVLVLLSLAAGLVGWQLAGRRVTVPKVGAVSVAAAQTQLRTAHLKPQVSGADVYSETVPKGLVAEVSPQAGSRVKRGAVVTIKLSLGPERYTVPSVAQLKLSDALSALRVAHLKPDTPQQAYSDSIPAGSVIAIRPAAGTEAKRDTPIAISVSRGPAPVDPPKIDGLSGDDAKAALQKAGLKVTEVQDYSETITAGGAISITPNTGLHRTDTVKLSVSKGPQLVYIPDNIEDYSPSHAEQYLKSLGLKVATFSFPPLESRILSASPGGGSAVRIGSTVTLYLY